MFVTGCGGVHWEYDLERGLQQAAQRQRPALVQFYSAVNRDCLNMDQEVFADPEVQKQLEEYVCIRLDHQLNRDLADRLGVNVVPTCFIFRCDRSLAGSLVGRTDATKFKYFLVKYRYF